MENINHLPAELRAKMLYYAHPKMESPMKRGIRVTLSHWQLRSIWKKWSMPFYEENGENVRPEIHWQDMLCRYSTKEMRRECFINLSQCGCCERHSQGVFKQAHCKTIIGSHTFKKRHERQTWIGKNCDCWCRAQMRHLANIDQELLDEDVNDDEEK